MRFVTPKGIPVIVNPDCVAMVQPSIDPRTGTPILGEATIILKMAPPNVPGATTPTLAVKGSYLQVALDLRIIFPGDLTAKEQEELNVATES